METRIYERWRRRDTSFVSTLSIISELLSERLVADVRKIWVDGSNSGRARLVFTIFYRNSYTMRFLDVGSLRQFRHDGVLEEEIVYIERFIESLRTGILSDIIE